MFFVFLGNLGNSKSLKDYMDKAKDTNQVDNIPKEYVDIFKVITEEPIDIDDIIHKTKLDLKTLISRLTMLELEGKIKKVAGNRYVKGDS